MAPPRLLLTCIDADQVEVSFEPYGASHILEAGDAFDVELSGEPDHVEVTHAPGRLTIWAEGDVRVTNRAGEKLPT